jgi:hypothetical protein
VYEAPAESRSADVIIERLEVGDLPDHKHNDYVEG